MVILEDGDSLRIGENRQSYRFFAALRMTKPRIVILSAAKNPRVPPTDNAEAGCSVCSDSL